MPRSLRPWIGLMGCFVTKSNSSSHHGGPLSLSSFLTKNEDHHVDLKRCSLDKWERRRDRPSFSHKSLEGKSL